MLENTNSPIEPITEFPIANEGLVFHSDIPFQLEMGGILPEIKICYSTYGVFDPNQNNVVWVCHALTGNANVLDWWGDLFGAGKLYDPDKYFIICANVMGSCYGSTGPLEMNKKTGSPFFADFPETSMRDIVKSFEMLRQQIGIAKIHTCIGGSLGGQQALEWAVSNSNLIDNLVLMATNARTSPWGIALNETQRMAICSDKSWGLPIANAAENGLKAARAIALLSYRSYQTYQETQKDPDDALGKYKAVSYQKYQGEKFSTRFNAYSYWALTIILDSHNVGRTRGGIEKALSTITAKTLLIGISSDILFPISEQKFMSDFIPNCEFHILNSLYGHDGFLMETDKIKDILTNFYQP